MGSSIIAFVSLLIAATSARKCTDLTIPITASARNGVFSIPIPSTDVEVTDFILDLGQQGKNYTAEVLTGYTTVSGNYEISAQYCQPDSGPAKTLQILTHGIGFDKSYWNFDYDNYNYSYVAEAVDQYGYSTFAWDRLGIGHSSHGNPLTEIQALLEVDALKELTLMLRKGQVKGIPEAFSKIVHIGHSFGSEHTYALTAMYPKISDGICLTGFSQNGSFAVEFLLGSNFISAPTVPALKAEGYVDGYLAAGSKTGVQIDFFSPGDFSPKVLALAYKTGQPVTVGELLTLGGETASINHFAGPVHIVTGDRDIPFCGGNCLAAPTGYSSIPAQSKDYIPDASNFKVTIIPGAGHGLNLEYSHVETYASILNYFVNQGLGPEGGSSNGTGWSH